MRWMVLTLVLVACGGGGEEPVVDASDKPIEYPVPDDWELVADLETGQQWRTEMTGDEVIAFYEDEVEGWRVDGEPTDVGFVAEWPGGEMTVAPVEPSGLVVMVTTS